MRNSSKKEKLYAVIGLGRFGFALAKRLAESGKDLIVIDKSETVINDAVAFTDNAYLMADLSKENLRNVGIQNCDTVIIGIGGNLAVSILTSMIVLQLGVPHVIAKALTEEQGSVLEKIGAEVIYPEREMGIRLANRLLAPRYGVHCPERRYQHYRNFHSRICTGDDCTGNECAAAVRAEHHRIEAWRRSDCKHHAADRSAGTGYSGSGGQTRSGEPVRKRFAELEDQKGIGGSRYAKRQRSESQGLLWKNRSGTAEAETDQGHFPERWERIEKRLREKDRGDD